MKKAYFCELDDRAVLSLKGEDTLRFLQGIVTNDVEPLSRGRAVFSALLTPQGKYLHDFILAAVGDAILLDGEKAKTVDLARRLSMYRLRAAVEITDAGEDYSVFALFGEDAFDAGSLDGEPGLACLRNDGVVMIDPRLRALGLRAILPRAMGAALLSDIGFVPEPRKTFDSHRLSLGVPEALAPDSLYPLEAGFDELNGISFSKGCYVGQEVTARMKTRNLVRKRILPVAIEGGSPSGEVTLAGNAVGELIVTGMREGLALVRVDAAKAAIADGAPLSSGDAVLVPNVPEWAKF